MVFVLVVAVVVVVVVAVVLVFGLPCKRGKEKENFKGQTSECPGVPSVSYHICDQEAPLPFDGHFSTFQGNQRLQKAEKPNAKDLEGCCHTCICVSYIIISF